MPAKNLKLSKIAAKPLKFWRACRSRRLRRRGKPPTNPENAAACTERSRSEPHRSKPPKNPLKTPTRTIFWIWGKENFLILWNK